MPDFTVWYSIAPDDDERSSMKCPFSPTYCPEDCAAEIAERLHYEQLHSSDGDTIIIYKSKNGPEVGRYKLREDATIRYFAYKVEADNA